MNKEQRKLRIQQLDSDYRIINSVSSLSPPKIGWIKTIRTVLNISQTQLAKKLKITSQSVKEAEDREIAETISLKILKQAAEAFDMRLFYTFIPKDTTIEKLIDKKANKIARQIIYKTANTMALEDQSVSQERLMKSIEEKTEELKKELPKYLWD